MVRLSAVGGFSSGLHYLELSAIKMLRAQSVLEAELQLDVLEEGRVLVRLVVLLVEAAHESEVRISPLIVAASVHLDSPLEQVLGAVSKVKDQ